jgi:hypothetical protein
VEGATHIGDGLKVHSGVWLVRWLHGGSSYCYLC